MPLVLAVRNQSEVVVATDTPDDSFVPVPSRYGPVIALTNRCCVLIAGNLDAVEHPVAATALPRVTAAIGAAGVAQLIHAALTLELVPNLAQMAGRAEIIVAGIDPVRHKRQPGLYYFDSARNFDLQIIDQHAIAAGATAALGHVLTGLRPDAPHELLVAAVKEVYSSTKLRWPDAAAGHLLIGTITPEVTKYEVF